MLKPADFLSGEPKVGPRRVLRHILVVELSSLSLKRSLERRRKDSLETGGYQARDSGTALCSIRSVLRRRRLSGVDRSRSYSTW